MRRIAITPLLLLALVAPSAAHAFGAPAEVASSGAAVAGPGIGASPSGGAVVAWVESGSSVVVARAVGRDGTLGSLIPISSEPAMASPPSVAMAGDQTVIGWVRADDQHLMVRRLAVNGTLGPEWDVSGTSLSQINGQAAVAGNGAGRVAVAWRRPNDSDVYYRAFDVSGGPSDPAVDLTSDADIALFGTNVGVGIGPDGTGVAVWHRNTDCQIIARRVAPNGVAAAQQDMSQTQADKAIGDTSPNVTVDTAGTAVVVWHHDVTGNTVVRRWNSDGTLGDFQHLSAASDNPSMAGIAMSAPSTTVTAVWQRKSDEHVLAASSDPTSNQGPVDLSLAGAASGNAPAASPTTDAGTAVAWRAADGRVLASLEQGSGTWPPVTGPSSTPTNSNPAPQPAETTAPPATTTPLAVKPIPALALPRSGKLTRGRVRLTVRCTSTAPCRGRVELRSGSRALASARINLAGGSRGTVTLRLRDRALKKLRLVAKLDGAARLTSVRFALRRA